MQAIRLVDGFTCGLSPSNSEPADVATGGLVFVLLVQMHMVTGAGNPRALTIARSTC